VDSSPRPSRPALGMVIASGHRETVFPSPSVLPRSLRETKQMRLRHLPPGTPIGVYPSSTPFCTLLPVPNFPFFFLCPMKPPMRSGSDGVFAPSRALLTATLFGFSFEFCFPCAFPSGRGRLPFLVFFFFWFSLQLPTWSNRARFVLALLQAFKFFISHRTFP